MMSNADQQLNEIHPFETSHRKTFLCLLFRRSEDLSVFFFLGSVFCLFLKETERNCTVAGLCGFPVTTDVWGFCGFLSLQVCGTIRHPKKLSGSGFMEGAGGGGGVGCKDVHIKIKARAFSCHVR